MMLVHPKAPEAIFVGTQNLPYHLAHGVEDVDAVACR
jgi:hypothetical protein